MEVIGGLKVKGGRKMELYVILCVVEGCEDCRNSNVVVGVFSDKGTAEKVSEEHKKIEHLHSPYVNVYKIVLNEIGKMHL